MPPKGEAPKPRTDTEIPVFPSVRLGSAIVATLRLLPALCRQGYSLMLNFKSNNSSMLSKFSPQHWSSTTDCTRHTQCITHPFKMPSQAVLSLMCILGGLKKMFVRCLSGESLKRTFDCLHLRSNLKKHACNQPAKFMHSLP
eukprot:1139104-Pelagomonas_calceolata.AAC.3